MLSNLKLPTMTICTEERKVSERYDAHQIENMKAITRYTMKGAKERRKKSKGHSKS